MHIVALIIATLLMTVWLLLLARVQPEDLEQAALSKIYDNHAAIAKLTARDKAQKEKQHACSGIALTVITLLHGNRTRKSLEKLKNEIGQLQNGTTTGLNILAMPGYVLEREIEAVGRSSFRKTLLTKCHELFGKKHAGHKASQLLAQMLSYPIIGTAVSLMLGTLLVSRGNSAIGLIIAAIGTGLVLVTTYALYDELCDRLNKRRAAICRQFPNVISKLALLVTSGMIMDRAWKETAHSQDTELYIEMRKTSQELDNLVSAEAAYAGFISRCNTKETAKLASAIMQNQSKGNAEIGRLLKSMAHEVWQERRHTAKRDAEKANSKLMIPTMLLFIVILVMLMVPIAMNFSGL